MFANTCVAMFSNAVDTPVHALHGQRICMPARMRALEQARRKQRELARHSSVGGDPMRCTLVALAHHLLGRTFTPGGTTAQPLSP